MSNVQFDTDTNGNPNMGFGSDQSRTIGSVGMARWLINHGFAKDESGARAILISIVIVDLIATALIIYFFLY